MKWADKSLIWIMALVMGMIAIYDWWQPAQKPLLSPAAGSQLSCSIEHISDGDSLTANCAEGIVKVRVHGIDAPELGQKPWGDKSRRALKSLLREGGAAIMLQVQDTDRYGRSVAIVKQGDHDIGLSMVTLGHAIVYRQYNDSQVYLDAERMARNQKIGIWETGGSQQNPVKWRRYHPR